MPVKKIYDRDGDHKPSEEFLLMIVIMLRRSEMETGMPLVQWLEHFEDDNSDIDTYDDKQLRLAVSQLRKALYPEERPPLEAADFIDEDDEDMPIEPMPDQNIEKVTVLSQDHVDAEEEPLPPTYKMEEDDNERSTTD